MIKVGITGIIGSGKSILSNIFEIINIPVYNADKNAKILMYTNNSIKTRLISSFGDEVYINNELNKVFLSKKIFNSEENRKLVNHIVHPIVISDFISWTKLQKSDIVAIESALLYEANIDSILDYTIEVKSPINLIIERLCHRDKISKIEAENIINIQNKSNKGVPDFIVINDEQKFLIEQTIYILEHLKVIKS